MSIPTVPMADFVKALRNQPSPKERHHLAPYAIPPGRFVDHGRIERVDGRMMICIPVKTMVFYNLKAGDLVTLTKLTEEEQDAIEEDGAMQIFTPPALYRQLIGEDNDAEE